MSTLTINIQLREIGAAVRWAMRAKQIPPGYSQAAEKIVIASELHFQNGIQGVVNLLQSDIVYPSAASLIKQDASQIELDANQQEELIVLPAIFDFVQTLTPPNEAKSKSVVIQNIKLSSPFLPELLAERAAQHNDLTLMAVKITPDTTQYILAHPRTEQNARGAITLATVTNRPAIISDIDTTRLLNKSPNGAIIVQYLPTPQAPTWAADAHVVHQSASERQQKLNRAQNRGIQASRESWKQLKAIADQIKVDQSK